MSIINIRGEPYTTATQDVRLQEHKNAFRDELAVQLNRAMQLSTDGTLRIDMRRLEAFIDQAYYMGREDAS